MTAFHSQAPWTPEPCDHLGDSAFALRCGDGDLIALGMIRCDAQVAGAAPDMLAALFEADAAIRAVNAGFGATVFNPAATALVREAIAKATGAVQ